MRYLWLCLLLVACDDSDPDVAPGDAAPTDAAVADATPRDAAPADAEADATLVDAQAPDAVAPDAGLELPPFVACPTPGPLDDTLRLDQLISLGTHNSSHVRSEVVVDPSHEYDHPPLGEQLDVGVRQFEFDLHWHVERGFEVFHLPAVDQASVCGTWVECLADLRRWSVAHPCHAPLVLWVEMKDGPLDIANPQYDTFLDKHAELEADLLSVWPIERLITPDDLRRDHPDLPTAIATDGWPPLAETRGTLLVTMLNTGDHRAAYLEGSDVLAGRPMFVKAGSPEEPWAATFKIDNAVREADRVRAMVDAGFLVTSNVNQAGSTPEANAEELSASLAAGPHHLSSDFVVPDPQTGFVTTLPDGSPGCHPRRAPADCTPEAVEPR